MNAIAPRRALPLACSSAGRPSPFPQFGSDADWTKWHRHRRRSAPSSYFDAAFVTGHALERLLFVLPELGCGDAVAVLPRPPWWFATGIAEHEAKIHGTRSLDVKPILAVRLSPDAYDLAFVDRATGAWDVPNLGRCGPELVSFASWRLDVSEVEAAWRLARLCGLGRAAP